MLRQDGHPACRRGNELWDLRRVAKRLERCSQEGQVRGRRERETRRRRPSDDERRHADPKLVFLIGRDDAVLVLEPWIGEALEHLVGERPRFVRRKISRGDDLLEQQPFLERPEQWMSAGFAHDAHAGEQRERRGRRVQRIEQAQLSFAVERDVWCHHDTRAGNGERRKQLGGIRFDGPQGVRLRHGEQLGRRSGHDAVDE